MKPNAFKQISGFVSQLIFCFVLYLNIASGQAPQAIPYQAVARDTLGNPVSNHNISLRFKIHDSSANGLVQYSETHNVVTSALGLFSVNVGQGTVISGTFSLITWADSPKFLQVEMDPGGGSSFIDMGTQQMLSVPYALSSATSSDAWKMTGNAGTNATNNFIGTTDNVSLVFKANNLKAGRIGLNDASTFFGQQAGNNNFSGLNNVAVGQYALYNNVSGGLNTALGSGALYQTHQSNNTGVGFGALEINSTGSNNTAVGVSTGEMNTGGSGNVFLGYNAGYNETGSNKLYVANSSTNPPLIYGDFSTGRIGLGNLSPATKLDVTGTIRTTNFQMTTGANNGYFLQSDASGNAVWAAITSSSDWSLTGNAGTTASNFIGTIDNVALNFKVNNQKAGRIDLINNSAWGYQALNSNTTGSHNSANGYQSLFLNTTGSYNSAFGENALYNNVAGNSGTAIGVNAMYYANNASSFFTNTNVAVGFEALRGSTTPASNTGNSNVAVGYQALWVNASGNFNTAIGKASMSSNTSGGSNTSVGFGSLAMNNTGTGNTAIGMSALNNNNSGHFNVAVGQSSLQGNQGFNNTAVGTNSLISNNTGVDNVAVGSGSLYNSSIGHFNIAVGKDALYNNVSGNGAIAIGWNALFNTNNTSTQFNNKNIGIGYQALMGSATPANNTGNNNIAVGYQMLMSNSSGDSNTGMGVLSLTANTTGSNNVALGVLSLSNNTLGNYNTAIGSFSMQNNADGNLNTSIGYASGIAFGSGTLSNTTAIGANAVVSVSNAVVLGNNANVGIGLSNPTHKLQLAADDAAKPLTNTWTIVSDQRLKNVDGVYQKGLEEILKLKPILFHYKNTGDRMFDEKILNTQAIGFLAQDVQKVFPECVGTDADGYLNLNIHAILIAYVNAIRQLADENSQLKKEVEKINGDYSAMSKDNELLKLDIENIKAQLGMNVRAAK
jgi:hypothetical protein